MDRIVKAFADAHKEMNAAGMPSWGRTCFVNDRTFLGLSSNGADVMLGHRPLLIGIDTQLRHDFPKSILVFASEGCVFSAVILDDEEDEYAVLRKRVAAAMEHAAEYEESAEDDCEPYRYIKNWLEIAEAAINAVEATTFNGRPRP